MNQRARAAVLLASIVMLAAALRLWHYDYNVGRRFTHDTGDKVAQSRAVAAGDLRPRNWLQPYFLPYSGGALLAVTGLFTTVDAGLAERVLTLYMIALAVGTVLLTHRLGRLALDDAAAAMLGAAILAVVPINVIGARYIKEDIPVMFWSQVALLAMMGVVRSGTPRTFVAAGLAVGMAIGTKFSAVMLVPVLALALGLRYHRQRAEEPRWHWRWPLLGLGLVPVGLLLVNPYLVTHMPRFLAGLSFQADYSAGGHHDGTTFSPWRHGFSFYLRHALIPGLSLPLTIAAAAGVMLALRAPSRAQRPGAVLLAIWVLLGYLAFESAPAKPFPFFARYLHALIPAMALLASLALLTVVRGIGQRTSRRWPAVLAGAAAAACVVWPAVKSAVITAAIADDTRVQAAAWMDRHLPRGSRLALDDSYYSPRPSAGRFELLRFEIVPPRLYDQSPASLRARGVQYLVLNNFRSDRFALADPSAESLRALERYRDLGSSCRVLQEFRPALPLQSYGFHNPVIRICRL
jgi:hypothetical protein